MIALLSGEVAVRRTDHVVVACGGVGYRLAVSAETLRHTPAIGKHATLHTHLIVRDDALALYGFATEAERDLFLLLIGVQSVGPKVALAVLSGGTPRELLAAVAAGDTARLQAVQGSASARLSGSSSSCARRSARRRPTTRSGSRAATTRGCWPARASSGSGSRRRRPRSCSTARPARRPRT